MAKAKKQPYVEPTRGWNFRIVRYVQPDKSFYYAIHEAYYSSDGVSITKEAVTVGSDDKNGIEWQLEHMHKALLKPVIDHKTCKRVSDRAAVFEMACPTRHEYVEVSNG